MSVNNDDDTKELFAVKEKDFGITYKNVLFEQYKIYLKMIDKLNDRRSQANNFFLSINTGLLTAIGILSSWKISDGVLNILWISGGAIGGILFSYSWYRTVKSYSQLSRGKWALIHEIEKNLPINLHYVEWKILQEGKNPDTYKPLTDVERGIPMIFFIVYVLLLSISILLDLSYFKIILNH